MILVDKLQPTKSVFSIGDFRHNIFDGELAKRFSSEVRQEPKNMLGWDDKTNYNPKVKKDSSFIPKYKILDQKAHEARMKKDQIIEKLSPQLKKE